MTAVGAHRAPLQLVSLWLLICEHVNRSRIHRGIIIRIPVHTLRGAGLTASADRHQLAVFAQGHCASELSVRFGVRRLDIRGLLPRGSRAGEEIDGA